MSAFLHCYICAGGGQILEILGLKQSPDNIMSHVWRLKTTPLCILTSILDVLKLFERLHMLWMGEWVHSYAVTPMQVGTKIENLGVSGGAQITSCLMFGGCKPPHSVSLIHIERFDVSAPSYALDGQMGAPLQCYTCAGGWQILEIWG